MEIDKKKFGQMLRKKRRAMKLSMQALGDEIGVTREAIRLYELGRTLPSKDNMQKVIDYLGISPARVFECSYDNQSYQLISEDEFKAVAFDSMQYMSEQFLNTQYDMAVVGDFVDAFSERLFHRT